MGLSHPANFVRFVSTILSVGIASVTTATGPANNCNNSQNARNSLNDDDEGEGVVHGPTVLAHVDLATRVGKLTLTGCICLHID